MSLVLARNAERGTEERDVLGVFGTTGSDASSTPARRWYRSRSLERRSRVLGAWIASRMDADRDRAPRRVHAWARFRCDGPLGGAFVVVAVVLLSAAAAAFRVERKRAAPDARCTAPGLVGRISAGRSDCNDCGENGARRSDADVARFPLRSAVAGTALAMAGVIGVAVFSGSLSRLTSEPARQGWGWDALVGGLKTTDSLTLDPIARDPRLEADPDVRSVTRIWAGAQLRVEGTRHRRVRASNS